MDKKEIYRDYINSLSSCISLLHKMPSHPQIVDDIFRALLLQAQFEYNYKFCTVSNEKKHEKEEKKNAR